MIEIINREMQIPKDERLIGVQGDNLSETRTFSISKIINGLDLSNFTILMQIEPINPAQSPYFNTLHSQVVDDKLIITWDIANHDTISKGNLPFQIQFSQKNGEETTIYQTKKDVFIVLPTIEAREEYEKMPPSVFEQYIERAKAETDRAQNIADTLVDSVDVAIANANTQANNAQTQATYAKNQGDNAKAIEQTVSTKLANGDFKGAKGDKGDKGDGLNLAGSYPTLAALKAAYPNGNGTNSYLIGSRCYIWNGTDWIDGGQIQGASAYEQAVASGYAGTLSEFTTALSQVGNKVDKIAGKGLSTNDYTTTEKNKLSGIANNANNYTHPANHPASIITQDANNRFFTDTERTKLSGIATGANNYIHPDNANTRHITDIERATWNNQAIRNGTTLWQGSFGSGSITVPNLLNYSVYIIKIDVNATMVLASRHPNGTIRGIGGMSTDGHVITYQVSLNYSGNTITYGDTSSVLHNKSGSHSANSGNEPISEIIGVI